MAGTPKYKDTSLPFEERVADLVSQMTLEEKTTQMLNGSQAIPRLDVPAYDWWNECLHGVARAGIATVFPQAIGLAATFNVPFMHRVAVAISDEGRAKHHEWLRKSDHGIYKGLTFWTPNINIFRDPRWGRGHETYGECPFLTARLGVAFVKGLQGEDDKYLKSVATPKHYAVHSGPEPERHGFDAVVSPKDLRETYLYAFRETVIEAKAFSVMGAYNRTNGEPCCASKTLLQDILRDEWGFEGYVVSDCGAIHDIHTHHKVTKTPEESAALAVNNGCELNCGQVYFSLVKAVQKGLITEETIDKAVTNLFMARFKLGMFDPPEDVPYAQTPYEVNDCPEHRELAREAARQSMVLLKNENSLLPLDAATLKGKSIAVIGPNAHDKKVLIGNYFGEPSKYVTLLDGIRERAGDNTKVLYTPGCELFGKEKALYSEAESMAERADVVVLCMGISPAMEGEEGDVAMSDGGGDRVGIDLPEVQQELIEKIVALGKPTVLVMANGSPVAINWAAENIPAIVSVWYPGEEGGSALADVLFGDYSPAGRLPVTFPKSLDDIPEFRDYNMKGRTYRYSDKEPLYPFGYGLSYTTFQYSEPKLSGDSISTDEEITVSVDVTNTGNMEGDEVVQLYLSQPNPPITGPIRELRGVERVRLSPKETKTVTFTLTPRNLASIDEDGKCVLVPSEFRVQIGGRQPDARSETLAGTKVVEATFKVTGEKRELVY